MAHAQLWQHKNLASSCQHLYYLAAKYWGINVVCALYSLVLGATQHCPTSHVLDQYFADMLLIFSIYSCLGSGQLDSQRRCMARFQRNRLR